MPQHRKVLTNRLIKFYHEGSHSFLMVEFPRQILENDDVPWDFKNITK